MTEATAAERDDAHGELDDRELHALILERYLAELKENVRLSANAVVTAHEEDRSSEGARG